MHVCARMPVVPKKGFVPTVGWLLGISSVYVWVWLSLLCHMHVVYVFVCFSQEPGHAVTLQSLTP